MLITLLANAAHAAPPITLTLAEKPDGDPWINMADPAGILNVENGITDAEAAEFDRDGKLLVTCSKADGRHPSEEHGKSAHVSVWNVATGELVWDRRRSRGPDENGDGFPDDQPSNHEDEVEIAMFSPDGRFVAAGGEDDKIEIWRVRADDHGADEWLAEPALEQTFHTGDGDPETDDAGVDAMSWTHDGRLLLAGTEQGGKVEIFRTQGDPATWKFLHKANHGGLPHYAVNSIDVSEDDRFVGTAGTDTNGAFWRLEVTEDDNGLITEAKLIKTATLSALNGKKRDGSGREARFEPGGDRHFIFTLEQTGLVQVYDTAQLKAYDGPPSQGPEPIQILTNGHKIKDGNEIEPAAYSTDGRFLVHDGDTRVRGSSEGIFPGYLRIIETAEIGAGLPMPDPVFQQRALATEYLCFNPDNTKLASGHGDGTVRLWNVAISGAETIRSEAFNDPWDPEPGSAAAGAGNWGCSLRVNHRTAFRGHRGQHYLAAKNLKGETHIHTIAEPWRIGDHTERGLQFAAVAAPGVFEDGDFLRLVADTDGDGEFETTLAEFLPDSDGDLALNGAGGRKLNAVFLDDDGKTEFYSFEDYFINLEAVLPADFGGEIRLAVEMSTDANDEEIGFDSLRVTGKP